MNETRPSTKAIFAQLNKSLFQQIEISIYRRIILAKLQAKNQKIDTKQKHILN
jgi:hypothetical protein